MYLDWELTSEAAQEIADIDIELHINHLMWEQNEVFAISSGMDRLPAESCFCKQNT